MRVAPLSVDFGSWLHRSSITDVTEQDKMTYSSIAEGSINNLGTYGDEWMDGWHALGNIERGGGRSMRHRNQDNNGMACELGRTFAMLLARGLRWLVSNHGRATGRASPSCFKSCGQAFYQARLVWHTEMHATQPRGGCSGLVSLGCSSSVTSCALLIWISCNIKAPVKGR